MGYAQHVPSPRGDYYLARYLADDKKYGTVKDEAGSNIRYKGKRDAKKAADAAEADVRAGRLKPARDTPGDGLTFGQWASTWYASLALAPSTMDNYKEHLELHVLPAFQDHPMTEAGILPPHVDAWENRLRDSGYAETSIRTYRATLRACLAAAVPALIPFNPAASGDRAGTGRRGVARAAAARNEKVITTVLGGLLIAERMALLTGRDDEFVMTVTYQHGGLRLGEGTGLEARYVTPGNIRVEWQLSEVRGKLIRAIPKDGSRGDVTVPFFLTDLLGWHTGRRPPGPCRCHGLAYAFTGPGVRRPRAGAGVTVRDVAREAGVPPETVWAALADDSRQPQAVRARVRTAARELGWAAGSAPLDMNWHWRHSEFERLLTAAASGWHPKDGKRSPERPVPLAGEWPGTPLRYRGAARRAELSWLPVARGLTPHSLRHSMRTKMEELGVPHVFAEAQLRHEQPGVYRHVTDAMRTEYRGRLQEAWDQAVARRGEMHPTSPVRVVSALLREAAGGGSGEFLARNSQGGTVTPLRGRR